jgi:hypothetical protein
VALAFLGEVGPGPGNETLCLSIAFELGQNPVPLVTKPAALLGIMNEYSVEVRFSTSPEWALIAVIDHGYLGSRDLSVFLRIR